MGYRTTRRQLKFFQQKKKAATYRKPTLFGIAIEVAECLPRNGFMMVSRLSCEPARYQVMHCVDGEIREWQGTLDDAYIVLSAE